MDTEAEQVAVRAAHYAQAIERQSIADGVRKYGDDMRSKSGESPLGRTMQVIMDELADKIEKGEV